MNNKNYKWVVVGLLWFVCFFNYADRQAIFSVFTPIKDEMGLSDVQLSLIGSAFMYVYALAGPLAGIIGDRLSRKFLIIGGLVFWSLVTVGTALATNYWHLVLVRALEGFGEAFYFPASMALISSYHGPDTKSRAMGIHQSSVYAGTIAGGAVSGFMGQHHGWRSSFVLFGSLGVLLGVVLLVALKEPARDTATEADHAHATLDWRQRSVWADIAEIFAHPMARVLVLVFVGANFVASIFLTWMPTFLKRQFGMSLSMAGLSGTIYQQLASVVGVLVGGILADRLVRKYLGGRMMTQAIGLFGGVAFIFLTGWTLSMPLLIAAMIGFGFFKGIYDANIWASLYDVVKPERRATAVGVMNSIGWLGGAVAPTAIAAASARYGMGACISMNSMIYLLFGLLMVYGIRRFMNSRTPALVETIA
ncbi:MAG TPA: MFS transporter [Blastocatellia bacterium]|nr:MFS transporter [Blastocatellia bacterium]HMV81577.1 MFS transporter [Blastocatellia bacterium]HMZ20609.1 MFS transporter [Blastocatellia bacterium]HNG34598.1 MFS transporter [Blastocatellia bacterium]